MEFRFTEPERKWSVRSGTGLGHFLRIYRTVTAVDRLWSLPTVQALGAAGWSDWRVEFASHSVPSTVYHQLDSSRGGTLESVEHRAGSGVETERAAYWMIGLSQDRLQANLQDRLGDSWNPQSQDMPFQVQLDLKQVTPPPMTLVSKIHTNANGLPLPLPKGRERADSSQLVEIYGGVILNHSCKRVAGNQTQASA